MFIFSYFLQGRTVEKVMKHVYSLYRKKKIGTSKIDSQFSTFVYELKMKWTNDPRTLIPQEIESIRKLQKKIVSLKAISFSDPRDHTHPIFENLSILPIDDLNNEAIALFAFKFSTKHFLSLSKTFSCQIFISITIKHGPHSKYTKNRHV